VPALAQDWKSVTFVADEQCALPPAIAQVNPAEETQQLATGEEELHVAITDSSTTSADGDQHQEEEDPNTNDSKQLQFDGEVSDIAGLDAQHDDDDVYCQKWL